MLFGILCVFLICLFSVVFAVLSVVIDNIGDKCIANIDRKRALNK